MEDMIYMLLAPLILIHLFYVLAVVQKNLSVIDTAWGLGFVLIALTGCYLSEWDNPREQILFILVALWGLRLALFIHSRNHGKGEDFRYANWRREWGNKTNLIAYFKVYWLQFFLMAIVALPLLAAHYDPTKVIYWFNYLGMAIWLLGLAWETIADFQKSKFKAMPNNHNRVMVNGLWAFSRHPNYFGEALLWWGISLVVLNGNNFWIFLGPAFITLLLWKVSGVPLVEQRHINNPEYQAYKARTPVLIPSLKIMFKRT